MLGSPTLSSSRPDSSGESNPAPSNANASQKMNIDGRVNVDVALSNPFPPFSQQEIIITPYEEELARDNKFQEEFHQQLLDLILEFHAWSTSRPNSESASAGEALLEETLTIQKLEEEQGMWSLFFEQSRLRLVEFITRIKAALAALTGFGI